jgi:hypothetical protein
VFSLFSVQSSPLLILTLGHRPTSQPQKAPHGSETSNHNIKKWLWHPLLLLTNGQWRHMYEQRQLQH